MKTSADIRALCAELGICDDRAERLCIELNDEHNQALELQRAAVDRRVWDLEDTVMEAKANGYVE